MQTSGTLNMGAYRQGDSLLHRLDPRLKLLLLLALVVCLFSATSPVRMLGLFLLWLIAAGSCSAALASGMKVFRLMRWLLLFTLLLHLCFTPGRTLFGTSWLSYDGLLRGLMVDSQVLLAVLFSLLLSWTTRPTELAWGLARLLSPLDRFKLPVQEMGGLLLLVLHFFPVIQEELSELQRESPLPGVGWMQKIRHLVALLEPLVLRLLERADQLAQQIVAGNNPLEITASSTAGKVTRTDLLLGIVGIIILALLWML